MTLRQSKTKSCAFYAFRVFRLVQAKTAQIPYVVLQARNDVVAAWRESANASPNG